MSLILGNFVLHQKNKNKNHKKTLKFYNEKKKKKKKKNQKILLKKKKKLFFIKKPPLTGDVTCFKLKSERKNIGDKKLSMEHTLNNTTKCKIDKILLINFLSSFYS